MPVWKSYLRAAFGLLFTCLAGCAAGSPQNTSPPDNLITSSAIITDNAKPGNGFLIDREERLFLTANRLVDQKPETAVAFAVIENGKPVARKLDWLMKAQSVKRIVKAKLLIADPDRDLAVVQLASVPEGVTELRLAKSEAKKGAAVRFLGNGDSTGAVWAAANNTVEAVGSRQVDLGNGRKATNQMIELAAEGRIVREVGGGALVNEEGELVGVVAPGLPDTGRVLATDLTEIRPVVAAAYRTLAMLAYRNQRYDAAIGYSVRGLEVWPDDPLGYNERGAAYSQKDQFDKAIEDYNTSIKLEPSLPLAFRNRGSAHFHKGRYKEALTDCSRAIDLQPDYASAYQTRSRVFAKLNMKKEAEADNQMFAKLSKPQPKKTEWQSASISGSAGNGRASYDPGYGQGSVTARTTDGRTVRLRPPVPGDPYYRGADGKRYLVIGGGAPNLGVGGGYRPPSMDIPPHLQQPGQEAPFRSGTAK